MMKVIGILTNSDKDDNFNFTKKLASIIKKNGGRYYVTNDAATLINAPDKGLDEKDVIMKSDIIICLGGDGTFLKIARSVYKADIPIIGVNLGSMGFLTEVEKKDMEQVVGLIIKGKYHVEKRMMLEAKVLRKDCVIAEDIALNDIVISRGALSRILHVKTYINDKFVDIFPGDGLIVSSPTGSTGYTLSAGGPIVEPDIELVIVTPICPHILYTRSFITTGERSVKAVIDENYKHEAMVTVDGQKGYEIRGGDEVVVYKSKHYIRLVRIKTRDFFNVLRTKIYFRGEKLKNT
jgi:NAD+ kinase